MDEIYRRHLTKRGEDGKLAGSGEEWTLEEIELMMERDKFLSAQEAMNLGIVDEILDRRGKPEEEGKSG